MKLTYQAYLLLTAIITQTTLAQPVDDTDEGIDTTSVAHTADGPPALADASPDDLRTAAIQKKCFKFTSDKPDWHFRADGVWSSAGSGNFGTGEKKICVPTTAADGPGGAIFIGPEANPGAGNTKFECQVPHQGKGNCDISLVDGYSLSVTCQIEGGHKVGGAKNLWKTGKKCPDVQGGHCVNKNGAAPHKQGDVAPFFREGNKGGNFYCTFWECKQDYFFPVGKEIKCHVSGGR